MILMTTRGNAPPTITIAVSNCHGSRNIGVKLSETGGHRRVTASFGAAPAVTR